MPQHFDEVGLAEKDTLGKVICVLKCGFLLPIWVFETYCICYTALKFPSLRPKNLPASISYSCKLSIGKVNANEQYDEEMDIWNQISTKLQQLQMNTQCAKQLDPTKVRTL